MPNEPTDPEEYPADLKTATRAEYVTMIRTYNKDHKGPGCPMLIMAYILALLSVTLLVLSFS